MGVEHLHIQFYVEGPLAKGTVLLHLVQRPGDGDGWVTQLFVVDVPGHQRIVLEGGEKGVLKDQRKDGRMFGVKWW